MNDDLQKAIVSHVEASRTPGTLTSHLADFVVRSQWADIPVAVRNEARRSIFNCFGTALGGIADEAALRLLESLLPFSGSREAAIIGHSARADILTAAFMNAVTMNIADFDDTHEDTILHPTAPVAPALFALSARQRISGRQLLHAFALGVEVEGRIANAVSPEHYRRGWHITSTCGVFGAAAAAGKLLGLDREQMIWALGNAAMQAGGIVETFGWTAKSVGVGNAARNGLLSAIMAKGGVTGPDAPLEGVNGYLGLTSDTPKLSLLTDNLGTTWELQRNAYKPYPCGVVLHPVIDGCISAREHTAFAIEAVERVTVVGSPLLKKRAERPNVTQGREAQISLQHAVAVTLLRGAPSVPDFSDAAVNAPDVLALRSRVSSIEVDPELPSQSVLVIVRLGGGNLIVVDVKEPTGSLSNPLSDADIERKFRKLAAYGCPTLDPNPLIQKLWSIEDLPDAAEIMACARLN